MSGAALLVAAGALVLVAGGVLRDAPSGRVAGRLAGAFVAGAVVLHLGLAALELAGVRWSAAAVVGVALIAGLTWHLAAPAGERVSLGRPGWGLVAAGVPLAGFGLLSAVHLAHSPDFVFHWGLKAARWVEERGVDAAILERAGAWRIHPDYPLLVTELQALPGLLAGAFDERAALLQTALCGVLTVLALRFALRRHGVAGFELEAATAACGAAVGGFGFVLGTAGSADAALAFALLVGVVALAAPAGNDSGTADTADAADAALAWSAAFAAAAKIEGVPLAALLLAAAILRDRGAGALRRAARRTLPALLVVAHWAWASHDRFLATNAGAPRWRDLPEILAGLGRGALDPEGGFFPLLLLLLPFVAAARPLRPAALVVAAQLALYVVLYLVSPVDLDLLLRVSAHRLLSHLVPAALFLAVLRASAPAADGRGAQSLRRAGVRSGDGRLWYTDGRQSYPVSPAPER